MLSLNARAVGIALVLALASSVWAQTTVTSFTGGDAGEGLDLQGSFPYAVNVRGPAAGLIGDAYFTHDYVLGVQVLAQNNIINWHNPNYGATANDNKLELVMQSIRWSTNPNNVNVNLNNLVVGETYKAQMLFAESCCNRGFDVYAEGVKIVEDFNVQATQGGINNTARGAVITHTFVAGDTQFNLLLDQPAPFPDNNPILNGFTLERVNAPNQHIVKSASVFTGGDAGEGLDLKGLFPKAINIGGPARTVGDANFAAGAAGNVIPGATILAQNQITNWVSPNYGASLNDNALEDVMRSIRWSDVAGTGGSAVAIDDLEIGKRYKLQLLFSEGCCNRGFDIVIDGALAFDDFSPTSFVGSTTAPTRGVVFTYGFDAINTHLNIVLSGFDATFADRNPTLFGLTLESTPEPATGFLSLLAFAALGLRRRR